MSPLGMVIRTFYAMRVSERAGSGLLAGFRIRRMFQPSAAHQRADDQLMLGADTRAKQPY